MNNLELKLDNVLNEGSVICPKCKKPSPEKREKCVWCRNQLRAPVKSSLAVPVNQIVSLANNFKNRSLEELVKVIESELLEEAKSWKKEDDFGTLTDINTILLKTEPTHNLYKVYIPISHKKRITLYAVRDKIEGMSDQQLENMLRRELDKKIEIYKELAAAGDSDTAKKVLIDDMISDENEALTKFHNITKSQSTVMPKSSRKARKVLDATTAAHAKALMKAGLFPKIIANRKMKLRSGNDIPTFSSNFIEKACAKLPQWKELLKARDVSPSDIAKNIKNAKVTDELVKFIITNNGMSEDSISKGAARSIAAASVISAAALLAADQQLAEAN